eukprot:15041616-Alexandrium_andersonii.AAC.1
MHRGRAQKAHRSKKGLPERRKAQGQGRPRGQGRRACDVLACVRATSRPTLRKLPGGNGQVCTAWGTGL